LSKIQNGEYTLAVSPVHWEEIKGYSDKAGASASQCAYRGSIMKLMVVL